ncbi:hypothetical protein CBER1_10353 [Cercospora berteroae]|uniref:Secreted protein n=1 Tax=Cercospora berteroae TaxID=357750 RepID=A0A2S6BYH6_9PEZI|nr:hypothetical protein CBER1_10353 [Cercospora berteroae]
MQSSILLCAIVAATTVVLANPVQSTNAQPAPTLDVKTIEHPQEKHQRSTDHHNAASVPNVPTASSSQIPRTTSSESPNTVRGVEYKNLNNVARETISMKCNAIGWITISVCYDNSVIRVQHCGSSAGKSICREHKRGDEYSSNGVDNPWCVAANGSFVPPNGPDDHAKQDMRRDDKPCEPWPPGPQANVTAPEQIRGGLDGYCYSEPEQHFLNQTCAGKEPGQPMKSICVGGWTEDKIPMAAIYNCTSMIAPTTCGITPGDIAMAGPITLCQQGTEPEPQAKCISANEVRNRLKESNSAETAKPT